MNGTTAELWTKMARRLKSTKIMIIGASQKRLRTFKKSHNSFKSPSFDIFTYSKTVVCNYFVL